MDSCCPTTTTRSTSCSSFRESLHACTHPHACRHMYTHTHVHTKFYSHGLIPRMAPLTFPDIRNPHSNAAYTPHLGSHDDTRMCALQCIFPVLRKSWAPPLPSPRYFLSLCIIMYYKNGTCHSLAVLLFLVTSREGPPSHSL